MSWDKDKPADGDLVFNSIGSTAIRENFQAIDTWVNVNHVGIGLTNEGKHKAVHFREVSEPATTTEEIALYALDSALTADGAELYVKREDSGDTWPITAARKVAGTSGSDDGWTYLPSGILIKWGIVSTAGGDKSYTFQTGADYPAFTVAYRCFLTPVDSSSGDSDIAIRLKTFTTTGIAYYGSPRTTTGAKAMSFHWLAIGLGI